MNIFYGGCLNTMPIVKIAAKSKYGFVINEVRGFVVPVKGVDVDTESKLYQFIKPYLTKGILIQDGTAIEVVPSAVTAKVVTEVKPVEVKIAEVSDSEPQFSKNKSNKKGKASRDRETESQISDIPTPTAVVEEMPTVDVNEEIPAPVAEEPVPTFDFS